ncbi:MAG: hypothetical protein GXO75_16125, partial [Calditrichaeota bacterium]|nr:hypothetical protein [Calditrichota bacterium]
MRYLVLVLFLFSCSPGPGDKATGKAGEKLEIPEPAIPFHPARYVCYKTDRPLTIDGRMDEAIWAKAEWTRDFQDIEGNSKPTPRFRTRAKMLWDDTCFYILAEIEEPDVWAKLKKRDSVIYYDNDFEVFIDPNGDTHRYYELEINAFSTEWDLFLDRPYRDDARALFFWDIGGLKSAVHVRGTINKAGDKDKGWTLEIALPWKPLEECADKETPPAHGDQWRVNFSRVEWKVKVENGQYEKVVNPATNKPYPEDNWVWSPQGVINMHYPEMWGFVQFSDKTAGSGRDEFVYQKEEDVKWALRRVYYRQKAFQQKNGIRLYITTMILRFLSTPMV